jgi:hypothetical protein
MLSSEAVETTGEGSHVAVGGGHGAAGKPLLLARLLTLLRRQPFFTSQNCIMFYQTVSKIAKLFVVVL